jgi:hypothetical protein
MRPPSVLLLMMVLGVPATRLEANEGPPVDTIREDVHTHWRWIGVSRPGQPCPEPIANRGWTLAPLFQSLEGAVVDGLGPAAGESEPPAPVLSDFCVYEYTAPGPAPTTEPPIVHRNQLLKLDRDFMGLMPSGAAFDAALAQQLSDHFLSQAGDVELPIVSGRPQVRLAVVDTAATRESDAETQRGTSAHGFTLLNLAKDLLCDSGGNCVAKVVSRLALAWECFDAQTRDSGCRNREDGGFYGLASEMARAIGLEVQQWRAVDPDKKLVMNLSIGWERDLGGTETIANMPAPALAVYTAIEYAACHGALVIAAAGNRSGGPAPESGAVLPAAWEEREGPSPSRCASLGVQPAEQNFPPPGASPYRPLVYAVGGVQANDGRLFNGRIAGEPRLVAFGDHATAFAPNGDGTATLTGSSVSSLVVSAATAAAWYSGPALEPYQVLSTVYQRARPLGRAPDFCQGGGACPFGVRRVSLCTTVGLPCPTLSSVDLSGLSAVVFRQTVPLADMDQTLGPIGACRDEVLHFSSKDPTDPCPHWQYYPLGPPNRATKPQPDGNACSTCPFEPPNAARQAGDGGAAGGTLYIEIDGDFEGELTNGTVKCGQNTWSLGLPEPVQPGATVRVDGLDCSGAEPMWLSFTVDGDSSNTSPILVVP